MKSFIHLLLSLALLVQGAMAAAMPLPQAAAPAQEEVMPCHEMAGMDMAGMDMSRQKSKMSCCERLGSACHAICAAAAIPVGFHLVPAPPAEAASTLAPRRGVLAAHRYTPLRPPIPLSV